jgi:hypothetical protein
MSDEEIKCNKIADWCFETGRTWWYACGDHKESIRDMLKEHGHKLTWIHATPHLEHPEEYADEEKI